MDNQRKLLYVSSSACPHDLAQALSAHRWQPVHVRSLHGAARRLREEELLVALVVLERIEPHTLVTFESCQVGASCQWIALLAPQSTESPLFGELALNYFFDHHTLPIDNSYLTRSLEHAYQRARLAQRAPKEGDTGGLGMVGCSPSIVRLRRQILKAGPSDAAVLIGGESGSGKELVARALHECSPRAAGPFVVVNCGALTSTLINSELFGHERGSFSGAVASHRGLIEAATRGTLFFDEVAELPLDTQASLLRYLQEKTIQRVGSTRPVIADARVVAASHVDMAQAVACGRFREDLYFRLNVLSFSVPPLRERREDIPLLAHHFFETCTQVRPSKACGFSAAAMAALISHQWPGNVRELFNRVQRAMIMTEHRMLTTTDLELAEQPENERMDLQEVRSRAERGAIALSLQRAGQNVSLAARDLGVSRMTLYRLMAKHGIGAAAQAPVDESARVVPDGARLLPRRRRPK